MQSRIVVYADDLPAALTAYKRSIQLLLTVLLLLLPLEAVRAEGSWQMGLFEGLTHRQALYETNAGTGYNILSVDILTPGEVINVHVCGTADKIRRSLTRTSMSPLWRVPIRYT